MKKIILTALLFVGVLSSMGQSTSELYNISNFNFTGITARSAAMGGAFTSLGADLSSMSINPAGLAMYSSSEFGMTVGLNIANTKTNYGGDNSFSDGKTRFTMPNLAGVFKDGNFTVGFGVNMLANFNSQKTAFGNAEQFNSRARIWVDQLHGTNSNSLDNEKTLFDGVNPLMWNAVMGYDSYMIKSTGKNSSSYGLWGIIDPDDMIAPDYASTTKGALSEFVISTGYNLDSRFYFGATLGIQSLQYNESSLYEEYNYVDKYTTGDLNDFYLRNWVNLSGVGINLKVGAIARPLPWLRVGVSYHSPSWLNVSEVSSADMQPYLEEGKSRYSYTPELLQDYYLSTPSRLLTGISAAIGGIAIVSFDYEATWYKSMIYNTEINTYGWRENTLPNDIDNLPKIAQYTNRNGDIDLNGMVDDYYATVNNFRLGVEVMPIPQLYLRAGYNYSTSPYEDVASTYVSGAKMSDYGAITRYSGGIGYRAGFFNIDLTYVYTGYESLPSKFFDYVTVNSYDPDFKNEGIIGAGTEIASQEAIFQKNNYHNILLTFSFRL